MAKNPSLERILALISATIQETTGRALELTPETSLVASGYLDSMSMVQLVVAMQAEFGVELEVADLTAENFESARTIWGLLTQDSD